MVAEDTAGKSRKPGKLCRLLWVCVPACLPLPAKAVPAPSPVLFPAVSQKRRFWANCYVLAPRDGNPRRSARREGQRTEERRDSSGGGGCPAGAAEGPGPAAMAGRLPLGGGQQGPGPRQLRGCSLCPEERESVPRQRRERTLPGEDDTALPEALSYFMPGIYRSSGIRPVRLTPQTSRAALRCRRCPLRPAPAVPVQRWLPGRQRSSAVPTPGAERASPPLLMGGNF